MSDIDKQDRIRARAYEIWERQGRIDGEQDRHWDEAKRELAAEAEEPGKLSETITETIGLTVGVEPGDEEAPDQGHLREEPAEGDRGTVERELKRQPVAGNGRKVR